MTSGVYQRDIYIFAACNCWKHECDWHGGVDATIDPEDRVNGKTAVWVCPECGCEQETEEGMR